MLCKLPKKEQQMFVYNKVVAKIIITPNRFKNNDIFDLKTRFNLIMLINA